MQHVQSHNEQRQQAVQAYNITKQSYLHSIRSNYQTPNASQDYSRPTFTNTMNIYSGTDSSIMHQKIF